MSPEAVVRRAIEAWDPYGFGPGDEYAREVRAVVQGLPRCRGPRDYAHLVSRVFSSSFGDSLRFTPERCAEVGARIDAALTPRAGRPEERAPPP